MVFDTIPLTARLEALPRATPPLSTEYHANDIPKQPVADNVVELLVPQMAALETTGGVFVKTRTGATVLLLVQPSKVHDT